MAADSGCGVVDDKNDNFLNTETQDKSVDDELARLKKDLELLKNAVSGIVYMLGNTNLICAKESLSSGRNGA